MIGSWSLSCNGLFCPIISFKLNLTTSTPIIEMPSMDMMLTYINEHMQVYKCDYLVISSTVVKECRLELSFKVIQLYVFCK